MVILDINLHFHCRVNFSLLGFCLFSYCSNFLSHLFCRFVCFCFVTVIAIVIFSFCSVFLLHLSQQMAVRSDWLFAMAGCLHFPRLALWLQIIKLLNVILHLFPLFLLMSKWVIHFFLLFFLYFFIPGHIFSTEFNFFPVTLIHWLWHDSISRINKTYIFLRPKFLK